MSKFLVVLGALLFTVGVPGFIWLFTSEGLGKADDAIKVVAGLIVVSSSALPSAKISIKLVLQ